MSERPEYMQVQTVTIHGEDQPRAVTECGECFALILEHREGEHAAWHRNAST